MYMKVKKSIKISLVFANSFIEVLIYRFISLCFISKDIKYKFCIVLGCLAKISKKTCLFFF